MCKAVGLVVMAGASQQGSDWRAHWVCGSGSLRTCSAGKVARDGYTKNRAGCFPPFVVPVR